MPSAPHNDYVTAVSVIGGIVKAVIGAVVPDITNSDISAATNGEDFVSIQLDWLKAFHGILPVYWCTLQNDAKAI